MSELVAAFANFTIFREDAVHGADRAMIDALIQQGGVDLRGRLIDEPGGSQKIEHTPSFVCSKGTRRRAPGGR
jgi:hypothetical protein